jgi:hypothetical protein
MLGGYFLQGTVYISKCGKKSITKGEIAEKKRDDGQY